MSPLAGWRLLLTEGPIARALLLFALPMGRPAARAYVGNTNPAGGKAPADE